MHAQEVIVLRAKPNRSSQTSNAVFPSRALQESPAPERAKPKSSQKKSASAMPYAGADADGRRRAAAEAQDNQLFRNQRERAESDSEIAHTPSDCSRKSTPLKKGNPSQQRSDITHLDPRGQAGGDRPIRPTMNSNPAREEPSATPSSKTQTRREQNTRPVSVCESYKEASHLFQRQGRDFHC